jgi:hypothetical protein
LICEEIVGCFDKLPKRGQCVVVEQLIDPYDPVTNDRVLIFMFSDPDEPNLLWFIDDGRPVIIPRDASKVYTGYGGTLSLEGLPWIASFGLSNACKSWRPYKGFA